MQAQTWPAKPIRLIVPYPAGGTTDLLGRGIAQKMSAALGQQVVVENRPGAGGNIGSDLVAKSKPDGYTLVLGTIASHAINPNLYRDLPYDAEKDFAPVALVASLPNLLVVNPAVPANNGEGIDCACEGETGRAGVRLRGQRHDPAPLR